MRKVLFILGQLSDKDAEWLGKSGRRMQLPPGSFLIKQGIHADALYILLDGELEVDVSGLGKVARLLPGEVVGEMSFVDKSAPSASVIALTQAMVLAIDKATIEAKIDADHGFGMRFYRALATFLSDRLRGRQSNGNSDGSLANEAEDELDDSVLDGVSLAGERFNRLLEVLKA
jgi:CRP/FNR family transcriptional regulator, cyclic AMP receptor protein